MSEYEGVQKGSLKFKGVSGGLVKKKKKKRDKERDLTKAIENTKKDEEPSSSSEVVYVEKKTPAELAFQRSQEKRNAKLIVEKASKTHKERIMEFNSQLDNLTEHFDIPKVSWTK